MAARDLDVFEIFIRREVHLISHPNKRETLSLGKGNIDWKDFVQVSFDSCQFHKQQIDI